MNEENSRKLVTVSYRLPFLCADFLIDENFCISLLPQAAFGHLFCIGDQIIYVNGKSPSTPKDASNMMAKRGTNITVTALRQSNIFPVSSERAKRVRLKRRKGFHYFIGLLQITSNQQSLGLAVRKVGEKVFVSKIYSNGIAGSVLKLGDCIIDVAEKRVTSDVFLKNTLLEKLLTKNECSLLIERAEYGRPQRKSSTSSFMTIFQASEFDPEMAEDAAKIGMKQSKYFRENCRQTSVFPVAAGTILKSSSRRGSTSYGTVTTQTSSASSNKKSINNNSKSKSLIILEPNLTKEIKMKMKALPPPIPEEQSFGKFKESAKSIPPRHVRFSSSISSTMLIPSDYSNRVLEKVQRQSHSYTVKNNNKQNKKSC